MQDFAPPDTPPLAGPSQGDPTAATRALIALHERTVDTVEGYRTMVEKAEPTFVAAAERFLTLHERHAAALSRLLAAEGRMGDADGTMMGTVNRAVVTMRSFFDDIDEDVMDQVRSGEDWVLKAFDAAITEQHAPPIADELSAMRGELTALLEETRHLG